MIGHYTGARGNCRFGMHSGLWTLDWTRAAAEAVLPEAAEFGIEVIELPVGDPARIDASHSRALCDKYGIEPTASLCLPTGTTAALQSRKGHCRSPRFARGGACSRQQGTDRRPPTLNSHGDPGPCQPPRNMQM